MILKEWWLDEENSIVALMVANIWGWVPLSVLFGVLEFGLDCTSFFEMLGFLAF